MSKGLLKKARHQAQSVIEVLKRMSEKNVPIIGLEPSCLFMLKDDYPSLISDAFLVGLKARCMTLGEFLDSVDPDEIKYIFDGLSGKKVLVHGHCHQKALIGMNSTLHFLRSIPGLHVEEIDSGCCGMAGSFGYESEHYDISMQIGEMKLFPQVRNASEDTWIIADGTSCRQQILDGAGKRAHHLAELQELL